MTIFFKIVMTIFFLKYGFENVIRPSYRTGHLQLQINGYVMSMIICAYKYLILLENLLVGTESRDEVTTMVNITKFVYTFIEVSMRLEFQFF